MTRAYTRRPVATRFWLKVDKTPTCWLWTAAKDSDGYGKFDRTRAHRASWTMANGPIPEGLYVCHRCDNPTCVRPDHLFLGTNTDNMRDKAEKQRGTPRNSVLSFAQRIRIEELWAMGVQQTVMAPWFGVSHSTISNVVRGVTRRFA